MTCKVRFVRSVEAFTALKQIWNELLSQSPVDNYFLRWEWLWNWWQVFANDNDKLTILILESDGKIIGIAPLYTGTRLLGGIFPVRRLMFLGTQPNGEGDIGSEYMDIIYKDGHEKLVVSTTLSAIENNELCDEIYFERIDTSSRTFGLLKAEASRRNYKLFLFNTVVAPYIQLPSNWEDYLNSLSSSMRYKIRKERRKMVSRGDILFKKIDINDDIDEAFSELIKLHQMRWQNKGEDGAFSRNKFKLFHQRMIRELIENNQLELILLLEGRTYKAAIYNISYKNKIYFYQSGIDTENSKITYGYLLHSYCIESAINSGLDEYDFLLKGTDDSYKDKLAKECREISDIYIPRKWVIYFSVKLKGVARSVYRRLKMR